MTTVSQASVVRNLSRIIDTLEMPLTDEMIRAGWRSQLKNEMVALLRGWQTDIEIAGELRPSQYKGIARWFLDQDVDDTGIAKTIIRLDTQIYDLTSPEPPFRWGRKFRSKRFR
jgi:hypothetical protein